MNELYNQEQEAHWVQYIAKDVKNLTKPHQFILENLEVDRVSIVAQSVCDETGATFEMIEHEGKQIVCFHPNPKNVPQE